jgi:hypothetical protein
MATVKLPAVGARKNSSGVCCAMLLVLPCATTAPVASRMKMSRSDVTPAAV